jgi:NAD-dependent deacetylase
MSAGRATFVRLTGAAPRVTYLDSQSLAFVVDRLRSASRITVLTGAGISAASGVPTFRGPEGLWRTFRPDQLATPEAFRRDPRLVWEWYDWRRQRIAACLPNSGHNVLAAWSGRLPGFRLITQNVDGLHERAGTRGALRMHGSIWEIECWARCTGAPARWRDDRVPLTDIPPRCGYCGGLARPGVVWFGESLDPDVLAACVDATRCDVFLAVGTSSVVYPAASLLEQAKQGGACAIEINLEATPASAVVDLMVHGPAERVLDEIDRLL